MGGHIGHILKYFTPSTIVLSWGGITGALPHSVFLIFLY